MFHLKSPDGVTLKVSKDYMRLGRSSDNDIVVSDSAVSRHHVNFFVKEGRLIAEDAGSQNGFLVNGKTVQGSIFLSSGDKIFIGSREYLIEDLNKAAAPKLVMPPPREAQKFDSVKRAPPAQTSSTLIWILASAGILIVGGLALKNGAQDSGPARAPASESKTASVPLNADGYHLDAFKSMSLTEVQAEAKFRESMRDYDNGNYSRAILGFREALTMNPAHSSATEYLQLSENRLKSQVDELMKDGEKSASPDVMQYRRAKTQMSQVLTILSEQIPGYGRQVASESANVDPSRSIEQEENLMKIPCAQTKDASTCKRATELLKTCRQKLGDEDTIR